jgi:hypothetical protein
MGDEQPFVFEAQKVEAYSTVLSYEAVASAPVSFCPCCAYHLVNRIS